LFEFFSTWLRPARLVPTFLLLGSSLLAMPGAAQASAIHHHEIITRAALEELGWSDGSAIAIVCHCNVATDFARLPGYSRAALDFVMPATGTYVPMVRGLAETAEFSPRASVGFHFNSLYSYDDIATRWADLEEWTESAALAIARMDEQSRTRMSLVLLGIVTHAVQDFYSHANWVWIIDGYTPGEMEADEFPLWEELVGNFDDWSSKNPQFPAAEVMAHFELSNEGLSVDEHCGGLQTGSVRGETFTGDTPWSHRHSNGDEQKVVHELAGRATKIWVERIETMLGDAEGWMAKGPFPADD
jgi:hypothetical protein